MKCHWISLIFVEREFAGKGGFEKGNILSLIQIEQFIAGILEFEGTCICRIILVL